MEKIYNYIVFISVFIASVNSGCKSSFTTKVTVRGNQWYLNNQIINKGSPAEGLLMNVRMVNSVFEDRSTQLSINIPNFDSDTNTNEFIAMLSEYVSNGVNAFTISLQGGSHGYEGAINTAFNADGSLRKEYFGRVEKVIRACDSQHAVVILSCFYQRQHSHSSSLKGKEEIKKALVNVVNWIKERKFTNVLLEITNEYNHGGYKNWPDGEWLVTEQGQNELIMMVKRLYPSLLVSTSGMGDGAYPPLLTKESDFFIIHFNNTAIEDIPIKINELKKYGKPIICNEDDKLKNEGAIAMALSVLNGCGWGYMNYSVNQKAPFRFKGIADDSVVYKMFKNVSSPGFQIDLHSMKIPSNKITSPNDGDIFNVGEKIIIK
ncbi:MAG: cellulase family glycosylhydrolase [Dysgonamonadaceae bacterium]